MVVSCENGNLQACKLPNLPQTPYQYANIILPSHFNHPALSLWDNTPIDNTLTDHGATLGRVLFYDKYLSANNTIACASCHRQAFAFSDPNRFSMGFEGGLTGRHSMSVVEMGMSLDVLVQKLSNIPYYQQLFINAFGDATITSDRIAKALSQFMRSIVSYRSKYDEGIVQVGTMDLPFPNFTDLENQGKAIFIDGNFQCRKCHLKSSTPETPNFAVFMNDTPKNIGLDLALFANDNGIGDITHDVAMNGVFKSPTMRNIMVTAPYMHDGRFATMDDVFNHYQNGIQAHPNLDRILTTGAGTPRSIVITPTERDALKAFFHTLTDHALLNDVKFSDPFQ
jgi:cytochrome c peroxidase